MLHMYAVKQYLSSQEFIMTVHTVHVLLGHQSKVGALHKLYDDWEFAKGEQRRRKNEINKI